MLTHHTYFFTCITYKRARILSECPSIFMSCWKYVTPEAWVVLPDHFHALINVGERTISDITHNFKITYVRRYQGTQEQGKVWQEGFLDHIIRNEKDVANHLRYIHFNPVKHGLCDDAFAWEFSSIRRWQAK